MADTNEKKKGPGRNRLPEGEKKEKVWLLVKGKDLARLGGIEKVMAYLYECIENAPDGL